MKRAIEYLKKNKKLVIVAVLLIVLIGAAAIMFGSKVKTTSASVTVERTTNELKLMNILSGIDGVGNADVMITEEDQKIVGVIVVCEGAQSISVKNDIINAVKTVFNVEKSNIAIYAMK